VVHFGCIDKGGILSLKVIPVGEKWLEPCYDNAFHAKAVHSLDSRVLWSFQSNSALRSSRERRVICCSSDTIRILDSTLSRLVLVELWFL